MAKFKDRSGLANYDQRDRLTPWSIIVSKTENGQCEILCTNEAGTVWTYSWATPEWARQCARRTPPQAVTGLALSLGHELTHGSSA